MGHSLGKSIMFQSYWQIGRVQQYIGRPGTNILPIISIVNILPIYCQYIADIGTEYSAQHNFVERLLDSEDSKLRRPEQCSKRCTLELQFGMADFSLVTRKDANGLLEAQDISSFEETLRHQLTLANLTSTYETFESINRTQSVCQCQQESHWHSFNIILRQISIFILLLIIFVDNSWLMLSGF